MCDTDERKCAYFIIILVLIGFITSSCSYWRCAFIVRIYKDTEHNCANVRLFYLWSNEIWPFGANKTLNLFLKVGAN